MKNFIQLFMFLCWLPKLEAQSVVYVKSDAAGMNNGSSWTNAFISLDAALAAAQPGSQIWVAKGTYKPGNAAPNHSFLISTSVAMYGGFEGVETSLGQRNILVHETILNGDILGNDIPGNLLLNREDNVLHVVRVVPGANVAPAVIDGFTIKNGQTLLGSPAAENDRRGAGVLVEGKANIRNCFFTNNKAEFGGCVMAYGAATNGLEVYNCRFENNESTFRSAGIYFTDLDGASVRKCVFKNNKVVRGCLHPRTSINVVIDSCVFESNTLAPDGVYGTGIFNWQSSYELSNSRFINNTGINGVGIYNDHREGGNKYVEIENCLFEGNNASSSGSALFNWRANYSIDNCVFRYNTGGPNGGSVIQNSDTTNFTINNSTFEGNKGGWGGAILNMGKKCIGAFENCTFSANVASGAGGATSNIIGADITYKNCNFQSNTAELYAGAIYIQDVETRVEVEECWFNENKAIERGGAIMTSGRMRVTGSTFTANSAGEGGAIYANISDEVIIENAVLTDNHALTQGAIYLLSVEATLSNCLIARNINQNGAGGALTNSAVDNKNSNVTLLNCTIVDNLAPIGAGVAQREDASSTASMTMQNCLLQNPDGQNYGIESGAPDFSSNGGNQSSDDSMLANLNGPKDLSNTINNFVNPDNGDYHLVAGTAAINGGVAAGAPALDLEGNLRIGDPDVGAYEFGVSNVFQPSAAALQLDVQPNPSVNVVNISLDNAQNGAVQIQVVHSNGQVARTLNTQTTDGRWQYTLPVSDLPVGNYRLLVRNGNQLYQTQLVKM